MKIKKAFSFEILSTSIYANLHLFFLLSTVSLLALALENNFPLKSHEIYVPPSKECIRRRERVNKREGVKKGENK
jgi:hypothetical protein